MRTHFPSLIARSCLVLSATFFFIASPALAAIEPAKEPEAWTPDYCYKTINGIEVATIQGLECVFRNVVRSLTPLVGLAFFVVLLTGSFRMLTAGGDAKQVAQAKKTLTFAIAGLVLFFGIWFFMTLLEKITGFQLTILKIPS